METRYGQFIHERSASLDVPGARALALDDEGKNVLSYFMKMGGDARDARAIEDVMWARVFTHMIDCLFVDEPVLDLYEHWCRSLIRKLTGKELMSVY